METLAAVLVLGIPVAGASETNEMNETLLNAPYVPCEAGETQAVMRMLGHGRAWCVPSDFVTLRLVCVCLRCSGGLRFYVRL